MRPLEAGDPESVGDGRYRLVGRLGQGGMGVVYLGRSRSGRAVAVKVVRPELGTDPEFLRRFAHEVAAARRVGGFHTAPVVDADPEGRPAWLVTAYVPGPTLRTVIDHVGALPEDTLSVLAAGLAEALEAIHRAGVVHRDLKPANIVVAEDGPRVIDFGIARALDGSTALTRTGLQVGTPGYLAPEQLTGGAITPAVDMFALGVVLCQAAGGSPFGEAASSAAWLYRVVHEEPDLSAVPAALRGPVGACLAKDPARRPTPTAFIDSLTVHHPADEGWLPDAATLLLATVPQVPQVPATVAAATTEVTAQPEPEPVLVPEPETAPTPVPEPEPAWAPEPEPAPRPEHPTRPSDTDTDTTGDTHSGTGTGRRRGVALAAALVVCAAVVAGVVVWWPWDGDRAAGNNGGGGKASARSSTPSPAALPTAPLLVRQDTAPGWPGKCHGVIAVRPAATDTPRRLRADSSGSGDCDMLPQWAPDRASFAFTRRNSEGTAVWTAKADGSGARRITSIAGGRVSWSPDGTRLAVLRVSDGVQQLYEVTVADRSVRRLTHSATRVEDPAWSPDGRSIAICLEAGPGNMQIHLVDPSAPESEPRQVTRLPHTALDPVWSPDGKTFAYTAGTEQSPAKGDIRLVSVDGTGDRPLVTTSAHEMDPAWSADGRWVAFVRGPYATPAIYAVRADGTGERRLTTGTLPEGHPAWR
ncbi:protein kinase [Streptomyces sp. SKN60]|uniref:protein kinase domain-containing protein n=1 Tax=Streptomyces sp. SKN60 TaxID=2855506 RepID=UPI002247A7B4|nr:protein kinase [Streptomyces sp. SKN60]